MVPQEIRDYETYIVAFSGGKDSTATLLYALENLPREQLRVIFCDTGAEWPETYGYLPYIEKQLNVAIEMIHAGDKLLPVGNKERQSWADASNLYDMIRQRGLWPGARYRYCTKYLKMWPLRLATSPDDVLLFGERWTESKRRSSLEKWDANGGDFHKSPIFRPILEWTDKQVWDFLRCYHILPNPVYNHASRCGCWCCIMGRPIEVLNFCRLHPDIAQRWADLEEEISHTWKDGQSIGNLLRQARAQLPLFEPQPRFEEVAA